MKPWRQPVGYWTIYSCISWKIIIFTNSRTANRKGLRPDQMNARFFGEYLNNMRNNMQTESGDDGHLSCSSAPARSSRRHKKKIKFQRKSKSPSTSASKLRGKLIHAKNQISTLYLRIKGLQKSLKASETLCRRQVRLRIEMLNN